MTESELFQIMAQQVKDYALFLLDPDGRITSWNLGAQRIKGYAAEEIIGQHFSVFYPTEARNRGWPEYELEIATREGRFEDEGFRVRKDGSRFWANVVITALRDENGKLLAYSKITRDLTDRRQHEEALRESEERFRLLIESVVDYAIYMIDTQGIVTSWNVGAERMHGYKPQEVIGKHFSNFYSPEDIAAGKPWEALAVARREGRAENEGWLVNNTGGRLAGRVILTAVYGASGQLQGFANVTQDLSQTRHVQDLEMAAKRVNEFIAMLAHEIRNPLAPIQNAISIMQRAGSADSVQTEMRAIIARQATRLARIADDMIDITRVTRGTLSIERAPVNVADLIARSVEVAAPLIESAKHVLKIDVPKKLTAEGDLQRLVQVFGNLLNNAARYTPLGGNITIKAWRAHQQVVISVQDTGRGIAAADIGSIFQMFVQGRTPLQRIGEGLGVGLALARSIVELHGGKIHARSEGEGKGSEFIVYLPGASARHASDESGRTLAPQKQVVARRVLVVDDNTDAAATLDLLLKALGHETRVAYDGTQALIAFDEFRPEIVLLDIGLPGINGYDVARRLRTRRGHSVRIVAVTGWGQAEDRERSAEAGFDVHLVKPIDENDLKRIVENGLPGDNSLIH